MVARHTSQRLERLYRRIPKGKTPPFPVNAVLPGRRNNPPSKGIRALAVYNPIHYQELPELLMDFTASLTGKSPSTTGAGSEGLDEGSFQYAVASSGLEQCACVVFGYRLRVLYLFRWLYWP